MGFSRGVWVLWEEEDVRLMMLEACRSFIHMEVRMRDGREWLLTAVYAKPRPSFRRFIWERLDELQWKSLWLLIRDFNCYLDDEERSSKMGLLSMFRNLVQGFGLIDLDYIGNQYTWRSGMSMESRRAAYLDRGL